MFGHATPAKRRCGCGRARVNLASVLVLRNSPGIKIYMVKYQVVTKDGAGV